MFQRLILVKALCEDELQHSIANFVGASLGPKFAVSPNATMEDIYRDIDNKTPCIFVLSSGADPTGMLLRFAKKQNYQDRLNVVSLGQGQGPYAKSLIDNGTKTGDWVILQNCMLAKSWMPELDKIVFELGERAILPGGGGVHPDFRLFLTSSPADYFPVSVLQNGVKMTNEPPKGFRANILRSFGNLIKEEDYEGCTAIGKGKQWKKLLCGLAFFHANIQERRKFGPLGWNTKYAFDESDLETSIAVLRRYPHAPTHHIIPMHPLPYPHTHPLTYSPQSLPPSQPTHSHHTLPPSLPPSRFLVDQDTLPWDALNYVTGHINYGGRVTDDWDRRCLMSMLSIYFVPDILDDGYKFSASGMYYSPAEAPLPDALAFIDSLPVTGGSMLDAMLL